MTERGDFHIYDPSSEEEYRFLLENINDFIVKVDAANRFTYVSRSYCQVFGKTEEELLGHSFMPLVHPDDQKSTETEMNKLFSPPYKCRLTQRAMTKNGWRWLEWNNKGIPDDNGVIVEIIGVGRDINDLMEAQNSLAKSKNKLQTAFDLLENAVWDVDMKTGIASYSSTLFDDLGIDTTAKTVQETHNISNKIFELVHPDDQKKMAEWVFNIQKNKKSNSELEYRFFYKDRGYVWVRSKIRVSDFDEEGNPGRLIGVQYEIESEKKGEIIQKKFKELLEKQVLSGSLVTLVEEIERIFNEILGDWKTSLSFSQGDKRPFYHPENEVENLNFGEVESVLSKKIYEKLYIHTKSQYRKYYSKGHFAKTTGTAEVLVIPFYTGKNLNGFMSVFAHDPNIKIQPFEINYIKGIISGSWVQVQHLLAEKFLYDSLKIAEEADKLKSTFMANISHELRSPLNAIVGFSSLITRRGVSEDDQLKYSEIISSSGKNLLSLVNDIIDISKMEAGEITINITHCLVNNLLDQVYVAFAKKCEEKDITLSLVKPIEDKYFSIETDILRLKQVFFNLLENALKFTEKGEIAFGYRVVNNGLKFFVRDTGIGISAVDQDRIFDAFYQVEADTRRKFGGSGLGLAITKTLINMLGGEIIINSKPGNGTEFIFTVDINETNSLAKKKNSFEKFIIHNFFFPEKRILIVGVRDEEAMLIKETFKDTGSAFLIIENSAIISDDIRNEYCPHVIILDWKNSYNADFDDLMSYLNNNSDVPVIMQSTSVRPMGKEQELLQKCNKYLVKPFTPDELLAAVSEVINE